MENVDSVDVFVRYRANLVGLGTPFGGGGVEGGAWDGEGQGGGREGRCSAWITVHTLKELGTLAN